MPPGEATGGDAIRATVLRHGRCHTKLQGAGGPHGTGVLWRAGTRCRTLRGTNIPSVHVSMGGQPIRRLLTGAGGITGLIIAFAGQDNPVPKTAWHTVMDANHMRHYSAQDIGRSGTQSGGRSLLMGPPPLAGPPSWVLGSRQPAHYYLHSAA